MSLIYINGKYFQPKEARISIFDLGFTRAYAVFDFLRTYSGKPFYLKEHLNRLLNSAKIIGLKHQYNLKFLEKIVLKTFKKSKLKDASIKIYLTGGESKDFLTLSKANLVIIVTPIKNLSEDLYQKGGKLITKTCERILPQAKTTVYTEGLKYLQEAKKRGAIEVLLIGPDKKILECATSNIFVVLNKKLVTPKNNILLGVTRKVVINLAKKVKISVIERDIYLKEIRNADEVFITATNKEILPIAEIDNYKISNKRIGEITKKLREEFKKFVNNY